MQPVPVGSATPTAQPVDGATNAPDGESEEEMITRLVDAGLGGNMDEINALDNKVLRGKIKAAIIRARRAKA